ncbi:hypothetical protein Tco_1176969 [Tanacetum coccineum]
MMQLKLLERSFPKILRIFAVFQAELLELANIAHCHLEDSYDNPNDGIFTNASYDNEGAVADFTNLETIVNVSPIPTSRIHSIHPSNQILRYPKSAVQIRSKSGYKRGTIDKTLFIKKDKNDIMMVQVYVDDIIFGSTKRFQVTPKTSHLNAVKRIFRYLKGKPKLGLWYHRVSLFDLEAYSDSDYARANLNRKSTIGGCQFLGRRLISWQCKKQTIVATSTTASEYVAAANCCGQVLWIQNQMLDYGFNFMNTKIYIDNESTICIVKNPVFHSKTKHIAIRHHFIRDAYEKKLIQVLKIHTDDNVADLLTKAFDVSRFKFLVVTIGMINP